MITGKLNGISRAEVKSLIEENAGTVVSSVSKKLNYLIVGEKPTKRKMEAAKNLKIITLDQKQFLTLLFILITCSVWKTQLPIHWTIANDTCSCSSDSMSKLATSNGEVG